MKVFVVEGESGEMSGASSWLHHTAFLDREQAEGWIAEVEAEIARLCGLAYDGEHGVEFYNLWEEEIAPGVKRMTVGIDKGPPSWATERVVTTIKDLDPGFEWQHEGVRYTIHELDLVGQAHDVARAFGLREA